MYACIPETWCRFFEGVCGDENLPGTSRDLPHLGIRQWLTVLAPSLRILTSANIYSLLKHLVPGDRGLDKDTRPSCRLELPFCSVVDTKF